MRGKWLKPIMGTKNNSVLTDCGVSGSSPLTHKLKWLVSMFICSFALAEWKKITVWFSFKHFCLLCCRLPGVRSQKPSLLFDSHRHERTRLFDVREGTVLQIWAGVMGFFWDSSFTLLEMTSPQMNVQIQIVVGLKRSRRAPSTSGHCTHR